MTNDPVNILKKDHKVVEGLFKDYEALGDDAVVTKRQIVDQIIEELTVHIEMEETLCYPRFKEALKNEDDKMVEEAYVEHAGVKTLMNELETFEPDQPEFDANVKVLMEQIRHHVGEEEGELLPVVEMEIPEEELETMGNEMLAFKESKGVVV